MKIVPIKPPLSRTSCHGISSLNITWHIVCYVPFGNHIVYYSERFPNNQKIDYRFTFSDTFDSKGKILTDQ